MKQISGVYKIFKWRYILSDLKSQNISNNIWFTHFVTYINLLVSFSFEKEKIWKAKLFPDWPTAIVMATSELLTLRFLH